MKTRITKSAALILLTMTMGLTLNAQKPRGDGPQNQRQFDCLDLTEDQEAQITNLRTAHYKDVLPLRNEMGEIRAKKRTLISQENVDLGAVNKNIDKQSALQAKINKLQASHRVEMKKVLTDEQIMTLQSRNFNGQRQGRRAYCDGTGRRGSNAGYGRANNPGAGRGAGRGNGQGPDQGNNW